MSNIKSIGQGVRGLRLPTIRGFPLTLNVTLTAVLRTNVLHCDENDAMYLFEDSTL